MEIQNDIALDRAYIFRSGIEKTHEMIVRYDKPFHLVKKRAKCRSFINLFWHLFSGFTYYRYSIIDDDSGDEIIYEHISKNLPHFDFIYRFGGGYHIGPAFTNPQYRGRGFHPYIITKVVEDIIKNDPNSHMHIFVNQGNVASIKGIEKTGFLFAGMVQCSDFQYKLIEGTETIPIINKPRRVWSKLFSLLCKIRKGLKK